MSVGDEEEPFDGAVHLDRYLLEEQIQRLAESADVARSTWEELRRSARPARWEGEAAGEMPEHDLIRCRLACRR